MGNQEINAITYEQLEIKGFDYLHIENFTLTQKINEHTILEFTGTIEQEKEEQIVYYTQAGSAVEVYYYIDKKEEKKCMFKGIVTKISVKDNKQLKQLHVIAYSNTYFLDQAEMSRSFQNTSMTYQQLFQQVLKDNEKSETIYLTPATEQIKDFIIQYKETNWEFLKRMASRFYIGLIPAFDNEAPKFYYGTKNQNTMKEIKVQEYSMIKDIKSYQIDNKNYIKGMSETDYINYEIKSIELYRIGEVVLFKKINFYIKEAVYKMENGIILGYYQMGTRNSLKQRPIYNCKIRGISLNGLVAGVKRDKVQIQLFIDGDNKNAVYEFPYSTMSASPDGSGWYCMPEPGDEIRVYFPDLEEKNCYAISSVSGYTPDGTDSTDRMADPSVRYLRTPDNKELTLTQNGISINADDGQAIINLDNEGNVSIVGQKKVSITAAEEVTITAGTSVSIYAQENIELESSGGKLVMEESGDTSIQASYVLEN